MPKTTLTTESGAPVVDNQHSQTAGPSGPVLLQDQHLIEKLARFNRGRIPERVVHANGSAAHGTFVVTRDVTRWTRARFLAVVGRGTETFVRFSTVAGGRGSADAVRDPRGFAVKFYTEDGNYDLAGNNTPIFFIRDPLKFPDFIHSQKPDPFTNHQEPDNVWDFFSHSPEATHMFTWLFGDRGIPASYRHMDGFGSHTFQWVNADGRAVWVKYHFKTNQGIECLDSSEAAELAGRNPDSHQLDLIESIERGEFPVWTLSVQIMTPEQAAASPVNPFDLTKVWSQKEYPLHEVGTLTLNGNADNYFADVEQSGFDPANFVPGIGPSPDKMLQGRLFAYGDAHRYRLGINHTQLPVNAPHATEARNYGRDGLMAGHDNGGRARNYEPNSFDGPVESHQPYTTPLELAGATGTFEWDTRDTDDFTQAGDLYRLQPAEARARLVDNIAGGLGAVSAGPIGDGIVDRSIAHFRSADPDFGERIAQGVKERRGDVADLLADRLQSRGWRITPQRRAVITALHGEHVHLSAEQVLAGARRVVPEVSLATVYNALNELVAMGEISEIRLSDGTTRYDPKIGPDHHHLVCEGCGLTFDVEPRGVDGLTLPRVQRYGMTVDSVEVVFRGRCSNCAEHS